MKKKWMKMMAVGLMFTMLSGCGNAGGNSGTKGTSATESKVKEVDSGQTDAGSEAKESNYPDYLNLDSFRPIVKEGEEVTLKVITRRESIATSNISENWFVKFIEKELNIHLDIEEVSDSTVNERKNLMLASNDLPDLILNMNLTANDMVMYGSEGDQFLPMSDYISEELTPNLYALLQENERARIDNTTPDGKMYTVPSFMANYPGRGDTIGTQKVFIDTKYMEAAGIEKTPETLDEFVEMLRVFKNLDPASMGVDEIWPMVSTGGKDKDYLASAFGWIGGGSDVTAPVWDVEEKKVVIPCSQKKYAEYVKLLNTLYSEGLIHPDFFTIDRTAARALYAEGKVPVLADSAPYLSLPDRYADFISAIPLSSERNKEGLTKKAQSYTLGSVCISADTKYPEVCMRLLDYFCSDEGAVYQDMGPVKDSEDTMGQVEGFYLDNGSLVYGDVVSGKYESDFDYTVNAIELVSGNRIPCDEGKRKLYSQKLAGVENPKYPDFDLTNPDDHYRWLCYNAEQGHLIDGLPNMYLSVEQSHRYTDLKTVIKNYVDAETAKFVVGQRSLDELENFFTELADLGVDEYISICEEAYADYNGPEN